MANNDRCQDCGCLLPADDFSSVCCDACYIARGIDLYPTEKRTHDYTMRGMGRDVTITTVHDDGRVFAQGWGPGITAGDYLILPHGSGSTRYQVASIRYHHDPPDMWGATLRFAPRQIVHDPARDWRQS